MQLKSFFTKSSLWISAALSLIFGVFVFATIDRTVYTTEQLIVVPDTVVSTTWIGIEKILSSELSGDSLYQDFSKINSAYLDKEALSMVSGDSDEIFSPIADEDDAAQNSNTNNLPQENEGGAVDVGGSNNGLNEDPQTPVSVSTESEVEDVSSLEINSTEEVEDGPSETLLQTSFLDKSIFWGGFSPVLNSYPLAQEILVEEASDTAPLMVESEEGDSLDFDLSDDQGDVMTEVEFEQETNEGTSTNDENTVGSIDTEEFNYNSPEDQLIEGSVTKIEDACLGDINCKLYSTIFSGFSMPEFESGTFLASAQLRLSLAAKTKSLPPQGPQRFVVEYNYDEMGEWQIATTIDIEDETSNSINGDHFLVSLEKPNHQSQLANLQVRVSYQGNIEYLERAFIEGLWLQVTSASFYEETDPNFLNGAINYSRDLEAPKFHDLNEANLDPVLSDLPAFTLSYSPQQGFFRRIFNTIFSENEYQVDSVKLTNSHGEVVTVPIDVTYHDNLTWTLQFLKQPQKMIPGKYTMELVINENDTLYADTFEFYWGVLAVNTTKSMYFSGEAVVLNLAALTDKGDTICDASLQLKIIDPTYTIYEIPVERSGACGKNNVTDIPDYLAYFNNASEIGRYTIQLQHLNQKGEVVHNIKDHFEVREYIPFDIERTAPTRIYPPAPYDVTLNITAYRDYSGDIVERVPRGFIFMSTGGAEVVSGPDYTELIWRDVSMVEGDQIKLSYQFDAPDISPYLYLLGPLNMSGFQELRQWQIASDALSAIALLTGTELTSGTNLNIASPEAIEWSFSNIDQYFYTHSTTTAPERITIKQAGDYLISVTLPLERSDANDVLSRVGFEVRVNGVVVPQGIGRSGLIKNQSSNGQRQNESSSHGHFLLTGLAANDYIEVFAQGLTSSQVNAITISGQASLLIENIAIGTGVFAATTTRTTNSVNLNQGTAYPLEWTETRQDIGFVHSDSINPENITISDPGAYLVYVNVPLHSTTTQHRNILGRIRLDGNNIVGGTFSQGYHNVTTVNDINASMHFSGIVIATTTNQVLSVTVAQESAAGNTIVPAGFVGSIYVQKLPTTEIIALRGRNPSTGTNWSSGSALSILWDTQLAYDSTVFTHSTSTNNQDIIINQAGDYVLVYNDALFTTSANTNANVTVYVNGTPQPGAQTKSHYVSAGTGHNDSSGSLVYTLNGLSPTDVVTVRTIRDASSGSLASRDDATILLWKKAEVNFRAEVDSRLGVPFDNIRFASTTPAFEFIADDPDGSSNIVYEFSISTSSSFGTALTYASDVDPGFSNVVTPADTSPFNETERVRYQLQGADALQDGETYYWRVRAKDVTGSGEFGDWSTTQSLTVDMTVVVPYWFQTRDGQFETNDLVGAVSSGFDQFTIDTTPPNEAIYTYSEGTDTSPRYRFWDGSSWGSESSALAVSGTVNRTVNAASSKRDEYVLATIDSSGRTAAQVYSASSSSWSNLVTLSSSVGAVDQRGIAVAYESISGDAVAVSCDGNNAIYRVWNGSSWSNATGLTLPKASQCQSIVIASHPNADEIIAVFRQVSSNNTVGDEDFTAFIWDGTDWEDSIRLGQSQGSNYDRMAVSYNSAGTQAMVIADFNTNPSNFVYTLWDGSSFGAVIAQSGDSVTNRRLHWAQLRANPNSDEIGLCFINSGSSIRAMFWNGISWSGNEQIDAAVNSTAASAVDCRFETTPGRSGNFLVAYSDTTQARYRFYDGLTWSSEANLGSFGQRSPWISMVRTGDGTLVSGLYRRLAARNLSGSEFNGTSWSAPTILETSLTQNVDLPAREPFFLSSRRFQFSEGVVTTQPINFTDVPNQATWGDASFTTTNAIGTDARVRIKYSNSGTCDAYVSNGALPGNDSGFDQASLPINLSGLSTSTYAQICLEATLSTFGDEDISLEEWELTWVRQPKLTQNNYRWFVNGSFVTPVKPWPPSGEDILENQSITAESAVSAGDVLRLRMSLTGQNIDLPVFTEAFKLQFASGLTCSASLVWQDVGEIGSTTAAWRGYGNATVGDDWYDGDWQRRIKITIDSDQVAAAVTDFPVYVDLSNLPTGFFNQVKSDGGDIRVTTSDGLTERPYDLASINTSLQTGELHFKANLSSTTDSEFYIYYGNPAASGYSASATYGSRNVWTNGFDIRYALNENPDNSAPQFLNSGSNSNHATKKAGAGGLTSSNLVTGKIGGGIEHTAANHGATFTQQSYSGVFTASMWWNANGDGFAIAGPGGAFEKMGPWNSPAGRVFVRTVSSSDTSVTHPADGTWTHVVLTRDSSNKVDLYLNGTRSRLFSDAAQSGNSRWENFGGENSQSFRGILDELRFANVQRSQGWVTTEYNNQNNPIAFYSISSEEQTGDGQDLPSTLLSSSTIAETYVEENPTRVNQNIIPEGDDAEWDFVIQNNAAAANTTYCFRMVYENGKPITKYNRYPRLITNAPPLAPELVTPFANEQLASSSPYFDIVGVDELSDEIAYQIQVSTDPAFGSTVINNNSVDSFALFTNLTQPAQRGQYTSGQLVRFIPSINLSNNTTYWWRVRGQDPDGSTEYGSWSVPQSFTINTATVITTWFQTTADQFATNELNDTVANGGGNDVRIAPTLTSGTTTSSIIDYNDVRVGNAWGEFNFNHNVSSGNIRYYIEYEESDSQFVLIPDSALPGNSSGFTSSPVSLISLDTNIYHSLRIVAGFTGNDSLPRLQDWTVEWGQRIDVPTLMSPFDNARVNSVTPSMRFFSNDPENDGIEYELQISTTSSFTSLTTYNSGIDTAAFENTVTPADLSPFMSGNIVEFTRPTPFNNGETYWWRARARDPAGSNTWSEYSIPYSFTTDTGHPTTAWYQTTGEQFLTGTTLDVFGTPIQAEISTVISGVMIVYGEGTEVAPRYRLWNGQTWSDPENALGIAAQTRWVELKAAPTRPEYALATLGSDSDVNIQIFNQTNSTWGNLIELQTESPVINRRTFNIAYETSSGDLLAIACDGSNAKYAIWNGASWSSPTTLTLSNANDCEWIHIASDPASDEIIAVFRHNNVGTDDFEAWVWNGSSWGNNVAFGEQGTNQYEGMAVGYNRTGSQAIVAVSNGAATTLLYNVWNGSAWSGTATHALGDHIEWAVLRADPNSDRLALCYNDNDNDLGTVFWTGASWTTFTEHTTDSNNIAGRPIDCQFETTLGREGYLMIPYSDNSTIARYRVHDTTTFLSQTDLDAIGDSWEVQLVRGADGMLHTTFYDDGAAPDRIEASRWNGSTWTAYESLTTNPSINNISPYNGASSMAAQIAPNFSTASILSNPINFSEGDGPRWNEISWSDTTPAASSITYRVYYEISPETYILVPDSALPGNASGFTESPIDISALDTNTYAVLKLNAQFLCDGTSCPSLQDWTVEWSEGITVSGVAYEYDQATLLDGGTVAVAVNGVLQTGKTGEIGTSIVTAKEAFTSAGTSTFTVPSGVTEVTVKTWAAGGGGGGGGNTNAGGDGGGGGYVEATLPVTPGENLTIRVGGGGSEGQGGSPGGAGGGGGYSAVYRASTPLTVAGAGAGGGGGAGGVTYQGVGTACSVSATTCTPTIPTGGAEHDLFVAVVHSRVNTTHTCSTNCSGWTEFSSQDGTNGRLSVWYYRHTGSTPANPTFGGPGSSDSFTARIWNFRGVKRTGDPYNVRGSNTTQATAATYTGDTLQSTVPNVMTVFVGGSMDDNTWGPSSGGCTIPNSVDANFYTITTPGNDNSIFLCHNDNPTNSPGFQANPSNVIASNGPTDPGRWFTFLLEPDTTSVTDPGIGGVGGLTGGSGASSGSVNGGSGATQSSGGASGGGSATAGGSLTGGAGGNGTGGGAGGSGGIHGGGAGGNGNGSNARAGGGGGGAGYYGGGGGAQSSTTTLSGAGGGGGSSYIDASATASSTTSGSGSNAGNSGDTDYSSPTGSGGSGGATTTNGVAGGTGRIVVTWQATSTPGSWSISNVNAFPGDVVTVFIDGADGASEAVAVTKYDGVGDITGMQLSERHLTLGSDDNPTITNSDIGLYQNSNDEDIFFSVPAGVLNLCVETTCGDARLRVMASTTYQPGANGTVINFQNNGTFLPATSTLRVAGDWLQFGTFTPSLSTIIFTATSTSPIVDNASTTLFFNNVTFGETSGSASWLIAKPLQVNGNLAINFGTLARGTSTINILGNLSLGANGFATGLATTTFSGSGSNTWGDAKSSALSTNMGYVVIDGTAKTITLSGNVGAETVTIGPDDTLNASGSGFNINVVRHWTNLNSFIPQSGTVTFVGTTTGTIARGTSAFNNLSFTGVGGNWSFSTTTLALNGSMTIATGTVTLPTGTTTIGASFLNTGGIFAHNNGEVRMTSTAGGRTITQNATAFLNNFYDLVFSGSGAWSFTESNATTSRQFRISAGTVTLPSGQLTVGGDFSVTGTGVFAHNNGEVVLLVQDANNVVARTSSFNNLRTKGAASGSWYNDSWNFRLPITIQASQIDGDLTNFPVYVNLDDLNSHFFSNVKSDGGDIRITESNGVTEVPIELVSISTGGTEGELYFRATSIASTTNTTYYLYYGNSAASGYASTTTFGARNVWSNGYVLVSHMGDLTTSSILNSAGTLNGTKTSAGNPLGVTTGRLYSAQDLSADLVQFTGTMLQNQNQYSISMWFNPDALTGGNADEQNFGRSLYGISPSGSPYEWLRVGGTSFPTELRLCAYDTGTVCNPTTGANLTTGNWYFVSVNAVKSGNTTLRLNGVERLSFTAGGSNVGANFTIGDLRGTPQRNINFDGRIDEVRVASSTRTNAWRDAEYRNMATTTTFYTAGGNEGKRTRTFTETNTTILGNFILDTGGDATLPTGILSIGGSLSNSANFEARTGTVRFNSAAGTETINPGASRFSTLEVNVTGGDITVSENATATVAINLTNATSFTLASGRNLTTLGTFTNAIPTANTTWTGSTLIFGGNNNITTSAKTYAGDTYATLRTLGTTTARFWNSSASTYDTQALSSIYSQDHAGVDGDLYIFGNYLRNTGTEHWSYGTDFDGAALGTSTSRQVNVRVASSSSVGLNAATFNILGNANASTTVDAQSGAFSINATNTTIIAEHFRFAGTGVQGFGLRASTTLSTFRDGFFTVAPGSTGLTISSTTVAHNPSSQFFRIGFATSSPGAASNVTLSGTTPAFVWFREGSGGLYGENFDNVDGNPGSIRWDDSSNNISISGTVYSDDGITPQGGPVCDGSTPNVRVVVDGGAYATSTHCSGINGTYSFPNVEYIGDPRIIVYLNTNGGVQGSVVTKTPSTNIANMHIYANRVIVRHEDITPLSIADMISYDNGDDSDIRFTAATSSTDILTLLPNTELYVFATTTFAPNGNITLTGNGNSNGYEGTLQIGPAATFAASGTQTHTLAGRFVMATTSIFNAASSTFIFNATTTGKSLTSPNTINFNQLQFNGVGGGWNITAPLLVLADMHVATGTVTGTSNITLQNGSLYGNGVLSFGSATTTLSRSNTFGGITPWTFNNLVFGNGSVVGTTTPASSATTTVLGRLTIANAHFLDAGSAVFDLAGTGTVFVRNGTFIPGTSTIRYSGNNATILGTTYYNAVFSALTGSSTFTGTATGINVQNNLTIGGVASTTVTLAASDPVLTVNNNLTILGAGTFVASDLATTTIAGSYANSGTFVSSGGRLAFTGSSSHTIAAGNSSFANVTINGTGNFNVTQNATSTGNFILANHANFTVDSGRTLAFGGSFTNSLAGGATTFTGSTLHFFGGGDRTINASTTSDSYETITVASGTNVRMWNSVAGTYSGPGGIYSQDHNSTNGLLHIYGNFSSNSANDHWSYATDFDGTDLTSSERVVDVRFASGASVTYTGGTLSAIGAASATTTLANQGSGNYSVTIGGGTVNWNRVQVRDISSSGVVFAGTPTVTNFSNTDHLVKINSASAVTVGGTVINANEAKSFTGNIFAADIGVTGAVNVTATGTAVSSWRFTNHTGNLAGEAFDSDPAGDPGYITWDDSAALITVSGTVYSDEGSTVSGVCDSVTNNIRLVVANDTTDTTFNTSCNLTTGAYSISNVNYSPLDTLVVYIVGESAKATTVTTEPISSISNLHLYENRVIVRHESTNPLTIARMAVWDSSDDSDIQYTAIDSTPDTLNLPANRKLLIWAGKTFEPNGNVTVSGGGAGANYDGTLEAQTNAVFRAKTTETHSVGGSVIFGTGATFTSASSTLILTTTGASRTFDVNANEMHNLTVSGAGSYNFTDPTLTVRGSYIQSNGSITFPTGTTTIGAAFNVTSGSFTNNGSNFIFTGTGVGNTVRFNGSNVASLTFNGTGSWNMTDTNATSTGSVIINAGAVTLPSGNLAVGRNFEKRAGTLTHNTADLIMTATSTALLTASSSDLYAVRFVGPAIYSITDTNITFLDSFTVASGTVLMASGTTAIGGSFEATGGLFTHATGTVLLNAPASGRTINPGSSPFYNLQIGAPAGGYTMSSATTTNNFALLSASIFTVNSGATISVGGVFTNTVGGAATTWTNSVLSLNGANSYSINSRTNSGDVYGTLIVGLNSNIRAWYSSAATTTVAANSSLYSQDHNNINGDLYIYGNLNIATTTEYWNYATDFDGTALTGGSERQANVRMAANATTTLTTGVLQIIGSSIASTTIRNQGTGNYEFRVLGGTLNANHYEVSNLNIFGLQLSGLATIDNLANGSYHLGVNTGSLITLSSTTLNANPSKIFDNVGFHATTGLSGYNINLVGETTNAWRFTNAYGNLSGEAFDIDGVDACGSIRFDNSACLLTEQTQVRWRNNDGGEGAPTSEWFDQSFEYRKRIRIVNNDAQSYASTAIKVAITYDSDMRSNFEDLRFTSDDGLTTIPYWVDKYTASTEAILWVRVPNLPASSITAVYMYYGSSTASSLSSGSATFNAFDDFEDNNISEYSGDSSLFQTDTTPVYGGTYALEAANKAGRTNNGLYRTNQTTAQGQIIRWMQYVSTDGDDACTLFGFQSVSNNYGLCLQRFGVDRMLLTKNIKDNDSSGTVLSSTTVTYTTGWYEVEVAWRTNNSMTAYLYNPSGVLVASTTATDSAYTSGGYGYSFWVNNGSWDSFTARATGPLRPPVYVGAKQTFGGASWRSAINSSGGALPGDVVRLRVAIENSGLDIVDQQLRLDYALKGVAPTCESVAGGSYAPVPVQASCGTSPVCMATSSSVANNSATTDLLAGTDGQFVGGKIVTDPSNTTTLLDINQGHYTEIEYVITPTINATDALCFRITNNGTALDFYNTVAELGLQFDPFFGVLTLNSGVDISLTPGTTTAVAVTGTITDFNGVNDIAHATATVYRSGAGAACLPDNNNCYVASTDTGSCTLNSCSGTSCQLACVVDIFFHADSTYDGPYEGQEWLAYAETSDYAGGYDFASALGVGLNTLRAISVDSLINYGALEADSDTGSFNPTTTVTNIGNIPINIDIEGTNLVDGMSSSISADLQKVATSSFTYNGCITCHQLSTSTPVNLGLNLSKPSAVEPPTTTEVYWGIAIPFTASNAAHTGTNIFTPISVD